MMPLNQILIVLLEDVTFYHDIKRCSHINEKRLKALNLKSFMSIVLIFFSVFNCLPMKIMWKHRRIRSNFNRGLLLSILSIFSCWYFSLIKELSIYVSKASSYVLIFPDLELKKWWKFFLKRKEHFLEHAEWF